MRKISKFAPQLEEKLLLTLQNYNIKTFPKTKNIQN